MAARDLRNDALAEMLATVCVAYAVPEKARLTIQFGSADFVMSRRIAATLEPGAADDPKLTLAWDEALGCLEGEALALAVVAFLRGLCLVNICSDRLAGQALLRRIEEGKLSFPTVQHRDIHTQVLADAFDCLAASGGYFADDVETLRGFAEALRNGG